MLTMLKTIIILILLFSYMFFTFISNHLILLSMIMLFFLISMLSSFFVIVDFLVTIFCSENFSSFIILICKFFCNDRFAIDVVYLIKKYLYPLFALFFHIVFVNDFYLMLTNDGLSLIIDVYLLNFLTMLVQSSIPRFIELVFFYHIIF